MLNTHKKRIIHSEYLQSLTSSPENIELDANKTPLALLAHTCSQIGKDAPPTSSRSSSSSSSSSQGDKEPGGCSSGSTLKLGEHRSLLEDKLIFKPQIKAGGDGHKDGASKKVRAPGNHPTPNGTSAAGGQQSFPPQPTSSNPNRRTSKPHKSPSPIRQQISHPHTPKEETIYEESSPGSTNDTNGTDLKKDAEPSKAALDGANLATSSRVRASANSGSDSCDSATAHDEGKGDYQPAQPALGPGHMSSIPTYKTSHPLFPQPTSMGYHGSVVGSYAGYHPQFVSGLDPTKSALGVGNMGVPGRHPNSSPLTGASAPSFMQGYCGDPYCRSCPSVSHLGATNCSPGIHDPPANLKPSFALGYPAHQLSSLHTSTLSSSVTSSLSHPLYAYGFMPPSDPLPYVCNWVSAAGPCDKRFASADDLLIHLRSHTAPAAFSAVSPSGVHLPHQGHAAPMPGSFPFRAHSDLSLARYHPYSKAALTPGPGSLSLQCLPPSAPGYPPFPIYSQRAGPASSLGYQ